MKLDLPPQITTYRLSLARLRYEDAQEIFDCYGSVPEATTYVVWPTHQSVGDTKAFLEYAVAAWDMGSDFAYSVRLKNGVFVGSFGVRNFDGHAQFGYAFGPKYWNQGIATEVCIAMMEVLKAKPELFRIGAFLDADNVSSARVLEKAGLVLEARLQKWHRFINQKNEPKDCLIYRLP